MDSNQNKEQGLEEQVPTMCQVEKEEDDPCILILYADDTDIHNCMNLASLQTITGTWYTDTRNVRLTAPQPGKNTSFYSSVSS